MTRKVVSRESGSDLRLRPAARPSRMALFLAFFAIYVVWGSTYLAIRYAVESIPPLVVAGVRHSLAGLALLGWAYARGHRPTLKQWRASLVLGTLYFAMGHGSLHWAETVVPSGLASLLVASEPIWIALLATVVSHGERLTGKTVMGLLLGITGVALLVRPESGPGHRAMLIGSIAIVLGAVAWSVGVFYSRSASLPRDPVARAGMPEIVGAAVLLLVAGFTGDRNGPVSVGVAVPDHLWINRRLHRLHLVARSCFANAGFDPHLRQSDHRRSSGMAVGG
jgi:drug/metabolite transporter (DMT)-like permease